MTHDGPQRTKDHNDHQRSTTTHNDPKSAHNDSNKNSQQSTTTHNVPKRFYNESQHLKTTHNDPGSI